jgi:hypothetical protein
MARATFWAIFSKFWSSWTAAKESVEKSTKENAIIPANSGLILDFNLKL